MKTISTIICLIMINVAVGQTTYYISLTGNNNNDGLSTTTPFKDINHAASTALHGDTILVMPGTYTNTTFGDGDIWKTDRTFVINNKTNNTNTSYLTIRPMTPGTVIVKGDGIHIIQVKNSSYIRVEGFITQGELVNIPLSLALQYQFTYKDSDGNLQERVPLGSSKEEIAALVLPILSNITRPTYFNTSGISVNSSHHIDIINNEVFDMPGEGIRSFKSDYLNIIKNTVYDCSQRSATGVHGLSVYILDSSIDTNSNGDDGVRVLIAQNKVYDNFNEIYSWSKTKTLITPHLDEGKGITVQRCTSNYNWNIGKIRIENNLVYGNGFSGIQINEGSRVEVVNNTCYENNYTSRITNEGIQHGISVQGGNDILISNNIIQADPSVTNGNAIKLSPNSGNSGFMTITDNLVFGNLGNNADAIDVNTITNSPLFKNPVGGDFSLQVGSPAINVANTLYAPLKDFEGTNRDANPDLGAIEYSAILGINDFESSKFEFFPNPTTNSITVKGLLFEKKDVTIYNMIGQNITHNIMINGNNIDVSNLSSGVYTLKIKTFVNQIYKK